MVDRYVRPEDALANVINRTRRGVRDVQRATGTEKVQAAALAVQASQDAAQAVELADGKLTISPDAPLPVDGVGKPVGAFWMRKDGSGKFDGYWEWTGAVWEARPLSETIIPLITTAMLSADAINGMTITGALIRTAETGQRMQFDEDGLAAYNSSGQKTISMSAGTAGIDLVSPATPDFVGSISNAQAKFERIDLSAWSALGLDGVAAEDHTGGVYKVGSLRPEYMSLVGRSAGVYPANNERSIQATIQDNSAHLRLSYRKPGDLNPGASIWARVYHDGTAYQASIQINGAEIATVLDLPGGATETVAGIVERATQAEVDAGTDTTRYVTPKTLRDRELRPGQPYAFSAGIADVTASWVTVTLPAGRFTQPPIITHIKQDNFTTVQIALGLAVTKDAFQIRHTGTSGSALANWQAIQMTEGSAAG